ncbi:MAG: hypothetical protein Q9P14_04260 [candidate division KSB1 bacterium]|nr:hypothetical protein [candidate division KSB1 bacterium]
MYIPPKTFTGSSGTSSRASGHRRKKGLVLVTDPRNYRRVYSFHRKFILSGISAYNRLKPSTRVKHQRDHWFWTGALSSEKRELEPWICRIRIHSPICRVELRIAPHGRSVFPAFAAACRGSLLEPPPRYWNGQWFGPDTVFAENRPKRSHQRQCIEPGARNSVTVVNRAPADVIDQFLSTGCPAITPIQGF